MLVSIVGMLGSSVYVQQCQIEMPGKACLTQLKGCLHRYCTACHLRLYDYAGICMMHCAAHLQCSKHLAASGRPLEASVQQSSEGAWALIVSLDIVVLASCLLGTSVSLVKVELLQQPAG